MFQESKTEKGRAKDGVCKWCACDENFKYDVSPTIYFQVQKWIKYELLMPLFQYWDMKKANN